MCAAAPIDKHTLLHLLNGAFGGGSGDYAARRAAHRPQPRQGALPRGTGFAPPAWEAMIAEMAADATPYEPSFETTQGETL